MTPPTISRGSGDGASVPARTGAAPLQQPQLAAPRTAPTGLAGPFAAANGLIVVAIDDDDAKFQALCTAIGVPWLATYPRFAISRRRLANLPELYELVGGRLRAFDVDHWLRVFAEAGIPCGRADEG